MKKSTLLIFMFFMVGIYTAIAQTRRISGKVLDESRQGLPGAGITVKGTSIGTATDADGSFAIDVPNENNTLVVRAIGYATKELPITGANLVIALSPESNALTEQVVTALGIKKDKKRIGYSASDVNAQTIERSGEQNVINALAAKTPGAQITSSSGTPGASSKILLRGNTTIGRDNQPLMIIDGIPVDNSTAQPLPGDYPFNENLTGVNVSNRLLDLNPNDIENITVLKGPAAAALYGARGGNGAILITTKKGRYGGGQRLGITYNTSVGFSKVNKLPDLQSKYLQGSGGVFTNATPNSWGPRADTTNIPVFADKYDKFFKTGVEWNNNISIDGGNEQSIFRLGLGNSNTKGVVPNSKLDRTTINLNAETKLTKWMTVGAAANYANTMGRRVQNGSNVGGIMLTLLRAPINYDVDNWIDTTTDEEVKYFAVYDNPKFTAFRNPFEDKTNRFWGNFYTNITFSPAWSLNWKIGNDFYNTETRQIFELSSVANDAADGAGQVNKSNTNNSQLYSDLMLRYSKVVSPDFELNGILGYNYWDNKNEFFFQRGRNLQVPGIYSLDNTSERYSSNLAVYERTQGLYAEIAGAYKSALFATVTGRSDWTTAFGRNPRAIFYPKADAAWVFSESIPRNNFLTYGKIRAAYADVGNGVDPYTYSNKQFAYYNQPFLTDGYTDGASFPYLSQAGYSISNINYPGGLIPAHTEGKEVGLELRLLKNRIFLEATYYNQLTMDNLIQKPVAPSTGFQFEYVNAGEIQNKGIELALNIDLIKNKNMNWSIGGNWARNRSKVLSLADGVSEISIEPGFTDIGSYAIVGEPYGVFYGSSWKRNANGDLLLDKDGKPQKESLNKNIGNPNPDWLMNLNTNFNFKGFYLSVMFDIRKGGDIWNGTWARLNRLGMSDITEDRERTYIIEGIYDDGTPNAGQANTTPVSANYYYSTYQGDLGNYAAENAIQDGSWVRLRQLNLGYRYITNKNKGNKAIDYVELGFTGRNLWLKTKYKGVDPETSLTGAGSNIGGWDYFNNPGTKTFLINLKVGF